MKYNKDKRTKNLTLREIHVGDWVQAWSEETELYTPPLKIMQICLYGISTSPPSLYGLVPKKHNHNTHSKIVYH